MAKLHINPSTVSCTEKVAAQLCSILAENGVSFQFVPGDHKIDKEEVDMLLNDLCITVRAQRHLRIACEEAGLDYATTRISDFLRHYPNKYPLLKFRNLGKKSLGEIQAAFADYGFLLE